MTTPTPEPRDPNVPNAPLWDVNSPGVGPGAGPGAGGPVADRRTPDRRATDRRSADRRAGSPGSAESTLSRMLGGLSSPQAALVNKRPIARRSSRFMSPLSRASWGFAPPKDAARPA